MNHPNLQKKVLYFCTVSKGLEDITLSIIREDHDFVCDELYSPGPGKVFFSTTLEPSQFAPKLNTVERYGAVLFRAPYAEFYPCTDWKSARIAHAAKSLVSKMSWFDVGEILGFSYDTLRPRKVATTKKRTFRISAKISPNRFGHFGVDCDRLCRQLAFDFQSHLTNWKASPRNSDLEIYVRFGDLEAIVGVCFGSLAERPYLRHFGTRSTLAFVMAKLASMGDDEDCITIYDPFCGVSAILAECFHLNGKRAMFYFGTDSDAKQMEKSIENRDKAHSFSPNCVDFAKIGQNSTVTLPFRDNCIDRIVSDIPHGRRFGPKSEANLTVFYRTFLDEAARILNPRGKMVLLLSESAYALITSQCQARFEEEMRMQVSHGKNESCICVFVKKL